MRRVLFPLLPIVLLACQDMSAAGDDLSGQAAAVLIAPDDLADDLQVLADWRCQTGLPTELVRLGDALDAGEGADDAARLRAYLTGRYEDGGLEHVILGGDSDVMPYREIWATVAVDAEQVNEETYVTSDLYFADLDGDWDPDGDGEYGELDDPADLFPDVSIGRLPVETSGEVRAYVDKLVVPELPDHLRLTRLYEDFDDHDGAVELTADSFEKAMEEGHNVTFQMGHGNEKTLGPLLGSSAIEGIDNEARPNILITTECLGGRFDYGSQDSSGEVFVLGESGGVAYLGATHLGIGFPSFSLIMQDLAGALFSGNDGGTIRLGSTVTEVLRGYSSEEAMHTEANVDRWTNLVTVLLGDPTVPVWSTRPRPLELAVDKVGTCEGVEVAVTTRDGAPVASAVVTAFSPDELLLRAITDDEGVARLVVDDCLFEGATITASGPDYVPAVVEFDSL
jgi:hypothetical protein